MHLFAQHAAVSNVGKVEGGLYGAEQRDQTGNGGFGIAGVGGQDCRQEAADEWKKYEENQGHAPIILRACLRVPVKRPCGGGRLHRQPPPLYAIATALI